MPFARRARTSMKQDWSARASRRAHGSTNDIEELDQCPVIREPHDRRARGTRPADRPPRTAPALRPPVLPFSGAGRARPSDRDVGMGSVPEAGGNRRRSGGDPDHAARRSLRGLSREADGHRPAVIGRRWENTRRLADRGDPNRERLRSGI